MEENTIKNCSHCKYYKWDMQFDEDICTKQNTELKINSTDDYYCENWIFHDPEYYYKQLQLKDKMIELMAETIMAYSHKTKSVKQCKNNYEERAKQALAELEE